MIRSLLQCSIELCKSFWYSEIFIESDEMMRHYWLCKLQCHADHTIT